MDKKITSDDFYGDMKRLAEEIKEKRNGTDRSKGNKQSGRSDKGKG